MVHEEYGETMIITIIGVVLVDAVALIIISKSNTVE